jgi:NTP pyrophosphatase (non-canonical NTP hydrolase)
MSDHLHVTGDALRDLELATRTFYERFGYHATVDDSLANFNEEVFELIQATLSGSDKAHIAEEAADVMVTTLGVCMAAGISIDALIERIYFVAAKNDAKNHDTHILKDGKIRRRVPRPTA